jgi:hypothetical protein
VKLPLPSFSRRPMLEKFFRVLLGGLMASSVPRGRPLGPGYLPSGVENGKPKTATCRHIDESGKASPRTPFSHLGTLAELRVQ